MSRETVQDLNKMAKSKLEDIVQRSGRSQPSDPTQAELIAARELLDRGGS